MAFQPRHKEPDTWYSVRLEACLRQYEDVIGKLTPEQFLSIGYKEGFKDGFKEGILAALAAVKAEAPTLVNRVKELSRDDLDSAFERGFLLKMLKLKWHEYEELKVGLSCKTGYQLIQLVTHERMQRDDWEKPGLWTVTYELTNVSDKLFEIMIGKKPLDGRFQGFVNYHTTRRQLRDFIRMYRNRQPNEAPTPVDSEVKQVIEVNYRNQFVRMDCSELIDQLTDKSISLVVTSPPYAMQRDQYDGISEEKYPEWIAGIMLKLKPKLTEKASVLIVIRTHLVDGRPSRYLRRTRDAIEDVAGYIECEELIWYKPDAPPLGAIDRNRRAFEQILWYSLTNKPFTALKACGKPSTRLGLESSNPHDNIAGTNLAVEGIARVTDVFIAHAGDVDDGVKHPALYPPSLVRQLIRTYAPQGTTVFDPFGGSGTTALVAQSEDYDFISCDTEEKYVELANERLKTEAKYSRGVAKREREEAERETKALKRARVSGPVTMPTSKNKPGSDDATSVD